jgi:hypothetical protein
MLANLAQWGCTYDRDNVSGLRSKPPHKKSSNAPLDAIFGPKVLQIAPMTLTKDRSQSNQDGTAAWAQGSIGVFLDIYLSAVDQSALAVPTSSLGPMSKIAQFSN